MSLHFCFKISFISQNVSIVDKKFGFLCPHLAVKSGHPWLLINVLISCLDPQQESPYPWCFLLIFFYPLIPALCSLAMNLPLSCCIWSWPWSLSPMVIVQRKSSPPFNMCRNNFFFNSNSWEVKSFPLLQSITKLS